MVAAPARARVCAGLLAPVAAAGLVAAYDPGRGGNLYPRCPFHAMTGLWCPGCGSLRGAHALLTGHPGAALGHNMLLVVVLPLLAWSWLAWLGAIAGRPVVPAPHVSNRTMWVLGVAVAAFWVLRNLPVAPFVALAP